MSESQEARQLELFGEKLFIEVNANVPDGPGKCAYIISSTTTDKVKYNQSLHEGSGLSRINADKVLQIEAGNKCQTNEKSIPITAHNGDIFLSAQNGRILFDAKEIVLSADTNVKIVGSRIQVGYNQGGATDQVDINGGKIHLNCGSKCTLKDKVLYNNAFAAFASAYVGYNKWYNSLLPK
tara:strand:- start:393 stop:935 length:543 start_codon:yes stop_codon:yes gene_type:complete